MDKQKISIGDVLFADIVGEVTAIYEEEGRVFVDLILGDGTEDIIHGIPLSYCVPEQTEEEYKNGVKKISMEWR